MFRKLRNKFLMLNMVTISVMLLIAFACIYIIMYQNISRDIDMELQRESDFIRKGAGKTSPSRGNPNLSQPESNADRNPPIGRSISFSLVTDKQATVKSVSSRYEMTIEFYNEAATEAISSNKQQGKFKLDGNRWAYTIKTTPDGYVILFLDITSQQTFLVNLIYAFLLVASIMLFIIYFISRFFANRSIEPVQEAFDKQKQFIADASHELKTPLTVINTNVDVLLANANDTIANQSKWLTFIKSESERMAKLTNDLLYLAQMDQTNQGVMFAPFKVSDAVEQIVLTMEAVIFERNIHLSYEIEPELTARGSVEQFKQVVMILLDNALKYTNPNGSVDITLKKRHKNIILKVTNTGEGISEEHLERIFDRFYRTDPSRARSQGGYGLGLAIAKAIIDQHKGNIYAKNIKDQKVSFYVELPLYS
ncbi:sensor histidine kinase [Paenibacillus sedimenti]|uniref:histidine kinase n=1 Tax=Paenibacillus sedimenti TaxID=2770274 RepID=A0A926QN32_9BACL|nr:HAMP domain-containing sensor histidine kinase [Paenibacillus sedimenti]MBD0383979.1 HAMP domain-containing histidine kinase [Paenibacillus sedimenti]